MGDFEWSPVYGKVSIFNTILHFDAYVVGGAGVVYTETSELPGRTVNFAADLGFGMRFVVKDFLAINAAIIDTAYVDQPAGTSKATTQNMLMLYAGFSLFIPFKSTYREEE
jgi:outer membrane beta-barrel protein